MRGADPNATVADGEPALMTVARTGNANAVRVLLAHGADANAKDTWRGQTALMWAAIENNAAAAQVLLEAGADVHARSNFAPPQIGQRPGGGEGGFTPLLFAVRGGHIETARVLLAMERT